MSQTKEIDNLAFTDKRLPGFDPSELRLLVVDNEAAHARAMTESLEKIGYKCEVATRGLTLPN